MKNCPYCGTPLKETNFGNYWCPNHGKIEKQEEEENGDKERSYLG